MDPKGRLGIPARHRERFGKTGKQVLAVTAHHQERCLVIRPMEVWHALLEQIQNLPNADREVQSFQRKLLGYAQEIPLDVNGRVLLSPALRAYAGMEKQVAIAGLGERLELWSSSEWDKQVANPMNALPTAIAELRL